MKNIKIILGLALSLIIINSCDDAALTLENPNELAPETFFQNETQVQSAVNAAYVMLQSRGLYRNQIFFMFDGAGQECAANPQNNAEQTAYIDLTYTSAHSRIARFWDHLYRGVNKANFVIGNKEAIEALPSSVISDEKKAKFIGEAKFLRGFYYFLLVTRFGDVPLIENISTEATGVARTPASQVYDLILSDFTEASTSLLDKANEDNGRATRGAALAMLGKTHLFMGNKSEAYNAFTQITGYDLEADYFDNFKEETEHGIESIFEVEFNVAAGRANQWGLDGSGFDEVTWRAQQYGFLNWWNVAPSQDLIDSYEPGDLRFKANFYVPGDTYSNGELVVTQEMMTTNGVTHQAAWKKYQNYYKKPREESNVSGINMKVIRYSDVLLMMAECIYESDPATARGYINRVRNRANLPDLPDTLTGSALFDAIVQERKVELCGEQIRFPDVVRWGIGTQEFGSKFITGKHELLPIPDSEIASNENISTADQNPGY